MTRSVEDRLQLLEDEREILRTMYQYAHALDYGLEDDFLDCFTEAGVFDVKGPRAPAGRRFEGRSELTRFFRDHTHAPAVYHKHLLVEPRITREGDAARVDSYFLLAWESASGPLMRTFGRYRDSFIRSRDGRWRLRERVVEIEERIGRDAPGRAASEV